MAKGDETRERILEGAMALASRIGFESLSIGTLAGELSMSKSGVFAHFGSKEELQLATVDAASAIFERLVIDAAAEAPPGVPRLRAYIERFLDHVEQGVFPGGCFFISAMSELDTHPGPLRDAATAFTRRWLELLAAEVVAGQAAGELDPAAEPAQIVFELNAFMVAGNIQFVASGDPAALESVRVAAARVTSPEGARPAGARRMKARPRRPATGGET